MQMRKTRNSVRSGITIKGDRDIRTGRKQIKAADISQVKKLFTGEDGFAKRCRICQARSANMQKKR